MKPRLRWSCTVAFRLCVEGEIQQLLVQQHKTLFTRQMIFLVTPNLLVVLLEVSAYRSEIV